MEIKIDQIEKSGDTMDFFNYPIDSKGLYRKKIKIKSELLTNPALIEKRIAILGGSTTNEVVAQLELFLLHYGIKPFFYQSEYGKYWEDSVFGNKSLDAFNPDIIFIFTSWRNILSFPSMNDSKENVEAALKTEFERYKTMWKSLENKFGCPIIQNNFDRPNYRLMGNRDIWDYRGRSNYISRMNQMFYEYAQDHNDFYINDLEFISQDYGLSEWNNSLYWHMYKCAMCMDAIPYIAQSVANIIKSIYGKNKKVLALDLDNTLWGGIVGDDGVEGIKIGPEVPSGQVYSEFQEYCKKLKDIGVVLAVDSKNDEENALAGLNHPDGVLKPNDFVSIKANWEPKDKNLEELADELTLGIDSFVFVDDNPAEREIILKQFPGVSVPNIDKPENYIRVLDHSGYFEVTTLSQEDMKKTEMYHAKAEANKAKATFSNYGEYLDSLEMTAEVSDFKPLMIQRIAQLTNKSNQFNLTTLRCTEDDIKRMQDGSDYLCLCGRLTDKFADNGIVTVIVGKIEDKKLILVLWLMSCRVLKRDLENTMLFTIVEVAKKNGIDEIIGDYYPTQKNGMVKDFYQTMGFKKLDEDSEGNTRWILKVDDYTGQIRHMKVEQNF